MYKTKNSGFTLIEMLLTVAILALLAGMAVPVYQGMQFTNDVDIAAMNVAQAIRRAQVLARGGVEDSAWGVYVATGQVMVFKGSTYAGRDTAFDEVTLFPSITITPATAEVVFAAFTGDPSTTLSLSLVAPNASARALSMNSYGIVTY